MVKAGVSIERLIQQGCVFLPALLLAVSCALDVFYRLGGGPRWALAAFYLLLAALVWSAFVTLAAIADWLGVAPGTRVKVLGQLCWIGNSVALGLMALSCWWRLAAPEQPSAAVLLLSLVALAPTLFAARLRYDFLGRLASWHPTPSRHRWAL